MNFIRKLVTAILYAFKKSEKLHDDNSYGVGNVAEAVSLGQEEKVVSHDAQVTEPLLWYPEAEVPKIVRMKTRGKYPDFYPNGAVIHYTAGSSWKSSFDSGVKDGYCFFLVKEDGKVVQSFPLDEWGYHAGKSNWDGIGSDVSRRLVGIEVSCPGLLTKKGSEFLTWYGKSVHRDSVREFLSKSANINTGAYFKFNQSQEKSLMELLFWLKSNNPSVFSFDYVLGHDEVSPGRKADPGGCLSMGMPSYRSVLSFKFNQA